MSPVDRAAQFGSFAALTGYSDAIKEEARLVSCKLELAQEEMDELNAMLLYICDNIVDMPRVKITYFVPDDKKEGGVYIDLVCRVKKVDLANRMITVLEDKRTIDMENVYKITGV
jgi:hypothetical protein